MSSATSESGLVAKRYAAAFLDMAAGAQLIEKIEKDMMDFQAMLATSADLATLIRNPLMSRARKKQAVLAVAKQANFQNLTFNFLGVLADNRRLSDVGAIIDAFRRELSRRRGEVEAKVQTAHVLTAAQTESLQRALSKAMGSHVTLNVAVDRTLLGGMVVTIGSHMIDDSVRRKLERLKRFMGGTPGASGISNENNLADLKSAKTTSLKTSK